MSGTTRALLPREVVFIVGECILATTSILFNSLVVLVIIRTQALHTVNNTFICSLAMADISVGLFVNPTSVLSMYGVPGNFYGCVLMSCVALIFTNVSILMLLTIALDRFFAIKEPFVYQKVMTNRRAYFINGIVWTIGINTGLIPYYGWHQPYKKMDFCRFIEVIRFENMVYFQFFTIIVPSIVIMFMAYFYIWMVVMRQTRLIKSLNERFVTPSEVSLAKKWYSRDVKASKMIVLAMAVFVCRFPINIINCITLFCKTCKTPLNLLTGLILLSHFNSTLNPMLYALSNTAIRKALKKMVLRALFPGDELRSLLGVKSSATLEHSSQHNVTSRSNASSHVSVESRKSKSSYLQRKMSSTTV